jgi:hypothetical protein
MGQLVAANGGCYNLTETKRNPDMEMPSPEEKYWPTEQKPGKGNAVKEPKVFENALLLTPTKDQEKNQNQNPSEPYKSPFKLPSVSPLLKKFTESNVLDRYSTNEVPPPIYLRANRRSTTTHDPTPSLLTSAGAALLR